MFRLPWLLIAGYLACVAVACVGLGSMTAAVLRMERADQAGRREAGLEENVRLALWRIDSNLAAMVGRESSRAYYAYAPAQGPGGRSNDGPSPWRPRLAASPAAEEIVVAYFQIGPDDAVSSPEASGDAATRPAIDGVLTDLKQPHVRTVLVAALPEPEVRSVEAVSRIAGTGRINRGVKGAVPVADSGFNPSRAFLFRSGQNQADRPTVEEPPQQGNTTLQLSRNAAEFVTRSQTYQYNAEAQSGPNDLRQEGASAGAPVLDVPDEYSPQAITRFLSGPPPLELRVAAASPNPAPFPSSQGVLPAPFGLPSTTDPRTPWLAPQVNWPAIRDPAGNPPLGGREFDFSPPPIVLRPAIVAPDNGLGNPTAPATQGGNLLLNGNGLLLINGNAWTTVGAEAPVNGPPESIPQQLASALLSSTSKVGLGSLAISSQWESQRQSSADVGRQGSATSASQPGSFGNSQVAFPRSAPSGFENGAPPTNSVTVGNASVPQQPIPAQSAQGYFSGITNSNTLNPRNSFDNNYAQAEVVKVSSVTGVMAPVWSGGALWLARKVEIDGRRFVQGCRLDWPALQRELRVLVADLLPEAQFEPVVGEAVVDAGRLLASIPARIVPGRPADDGMTNSGSPLQTTLAWAWGGLLTAAAAVAVVLGKVTALSERRAAFVSSVTHELRTPLTTFRLYGEMLVSGMVVDEERKREYLTTMRAEAERLSHLVENVLSYSRLERGRVRRNVAESPVAELLERVTPRLRQRAEQAAMSLDVVVAAAVGQSVLRTDVSAVEQILFNLVDNACKYAWHGERREISLRAEAFPGRITLTVHDAGPGVGSAQRRRLFRPFSKGAREAAETAPGVGLGLALSRRLARELGGDLRYLPGDFGATFVLELPQDQQVRRPLKP